MHRMAYDARARPLYGLLRAAAGDNVSRDFEDLDPGMVHWAIEGRLGPLLRRLTPERSRLTSCPAWPAVVGADLTARMKSDAQLRALEGILDGCGRRLPPLTLLKGISLGLDRYPAPYLRPMGDIDLLCDVESIGDLERIVRELGYRSVRSSTDYRRHHHIAPLVHPETDVCIEVHHGLFPNGTDLAADDVFGAASLRRERRPALVRGHAVYHLSPELQLVYVAAHWGQNPSRLLGPSGLRSMLDTMLILRSAPALRWSTVVGWLDGTAAASRVYLMLAYLSARGLAMVDAVVLDDIRRQQRAFGPSSLRLAFRLLDRYVFDDRPPGVIGPRTLALIWTGLLQDGGVWRKVRSVSSRLRKSAGRRWRRAVSAQSRVDDPAAASRRPVR